METATFCSFFFVRIVIIRFQRYVKIIQISHVYVILSFIISLFMMLQ